MPQPTDRTFCSFLDRHASERPDQVAIHCAGEDLTYGTLAARSCAVASALRSEGLYAGDCVAFLGRSSHAFFELMFGTARINVCFASLNWRLAADEIAYQIADSGARVIVADLEFLPLLATADLAGRSLILTGGASEGWQAYDAWRAGGQSDFQADVPDADAPALMMYTSGTTGVAKGVVVSQKAILASRAADRQIAGWGEWHEDEVQLVPTPLFHIAGCGWAVIGLYYGLKIVLMQDFVPDDLFRTIAQHRPTRTIFVPAMLAFLLQTPGLKDADVSSLKYIAYGASPMPLPLLIASMRAFPTGFVQLYGMTETCGYATYLPPEDHDVAGNMRMTSAGKPFPGVEISIRDGEGRELPVGGVGEVWLRTPSTMLGYWKNEAATREAIVGDWYRTGDGGYLDADGYLYLKDRIKDMIITGGENVYPSEVEHVLRLHPSIADVAVFGVPHPIWGEQVSAAVVLKQGATGNEDFAGFCAEKLAGFKVPRAFHVMDALPRNASGKVLKRALRDRFSA